MALAALTNAQAIDVESVIVPVSTASWLITQVWASNDNDDFDVTIYFRLASAAPWFPIYVVVNPSNSSGGEPIMLPPGEYKFKVTRYVSGGAYALFQSYTGFPPGPMFT